MKLIGSILAKVFSLWGLRRSERVCRKYMAPIVEQHIQAMEQNQGNDYKKPVFPLLNEAYPGGPDSMVIGRRAGNREGERPNYIANFDGQLCCNTHYFYGIIRLFRPH